ncbi:hypothetical protein PMAYCL1PPCAC_27953, partial [Pristionchus mayeri]
LSTNSSETLPEQKEQSKIADNPTVENPLRDDQPTVGKFPLPISSLFSSADDESKATDDFSEAFRHLNMQTSYESVIHDEHQADLTE